MIISSAHSSGSSGPVKGQETWKLCEIHLFYDLDLFLQGRGGTRIRYWFNIYSNLYGDHDLCADIIHVANTDQLKLNHFRCPV